MPPSNISVLMPPKSRWPFWLSTVIHRAGETVGAMKWLVVLLVGANGLSSKTPLDPAKVELPVVPQAKNVGKDGFPELPSLEDIMNPASKTMSGISTRAKELEMKMLKMEKENSARLEKQKKVFDRKLKEQEEKNQDVGKENAKLAKSIMHLKKKNEDRVASTVCCPNQF